MATLYPKTAKTMATLYGQADNFRAQKIAVAAAYGGVKLTVKDGQPPVDKFPLGLTPALEVGGKALSGDAGILWELSGSELKGQAEADKSGVVAWLASAEADFAPAVLGWVLPSCSLLKMDARAVEAAKAETMQLLGALDGYLAARTFLVGERLSLADLSLAFNLLPAFQHVLDKAARDGLRNLTRWFRTVLAQPNVVAVLGASPALCDKPACFDAKKFAEHAPKGDHHGHHGHGHHGHGHGKKDGGKKDGGKKDGAKKEKPAKKEVAEEPMDEEEAPPPKKSDPFDAFPKAAFNMDEFKRVYSNEDTLTKALPYLDEHMDWENHSVWMCEYKYPEDLGLIFQSCNLISGMFQRLDKLRKNCFASVCLFGENNASTISGVWIWRGPELAFTLSPDWQIDFESYEWTKMDPKDPKTKTAIKEYFAWEGDFGGKKFSQGKIFK